MNTIQINEIQLPPRLHRIASEIAEARSEKDAALYLYRIRRTVAGLMEPQSNTNLGGAKAAREYLEYQADPEAYRAKHGIKIEDVEVVEPDLPCTASFGRLREAAKRLHGENPSMAEICLEAGLRRDYYKDLSRSDREALAAMAGKELALGGSHLRADTTTTRKTNARAKVNPNTRKALGLPSVHELRKREKHDLVVKIAAEKFSQSGRFSLAQIAKLAGVSNSYLSGHVYPELRAKIDDIYGKQIAKLKRAAKKLAGTEGLTLSDIAVSAGLPDLYFEGMSGAIKKEIAKIAKIENVGQKIVRKTRVAGIPMSERPALRMGNNEAILAKARELAPTAHRIIFKDLCDEVGVCRNYLSQSINPGLRAEVEAIYAEYGIVNGHSNYHRAKAAQREREQQQYQQAS